MGQRQVDDASKGRGHLSGKEPLPAPAAPPLTPQPSQDTRFPLALYYARGLLTETWRLRLGGKAFSSAQRISLFLFFFRLFFFFFFASQLP